MVINKLVIKRLQVTTVEKKTLILSLPYLGDISFQARTKLSKSFEDIVVGFKLFSKVKGNSLFQLKYCLPFDLVSGVVYKYSCGRCNSS